MSSFRYVFFIFLESKISLFIHPSSACPPLFLVSAALNVLNKGIPPCLCIYAMSDGVPSYVEKLKRACETKNCKYLKILYSINFLLISPLFEAFVDTLHYSVIWRIMEISMAEIIKIGSQVCVYIHAPVQTTDSGDLVSFFLEHGRFSH